MSIIEEVFKDSVPFLESKGFDKLIYLLLAVAGFFITGEHAKEVIPFALGGLSALTNGMAPSKIVKTIKGDNE